jgi:hypothetical protein
MKTLVRYSLVASAVCLSSQLQAATVTGVTWFSGVASVAGESASTPSPGNDNTVGDSPNVLSILQKHYTGIGPVDLVFDLVDDGGTTEYIVIEGVDNSTGLDWSSYHIELGFGSGAGFTKSIAGDGLDFDAPDFDSTVDFDPPSPGFFSTVTFPTEDDLIASGGTHQDGQYALNYIFHIDVPDGISSFTIRQSPVAAVVPIPAAAWLFGSALLGLGWLKRY